MKAWNNIALKIAIPLSIVLLAAVVYKTRPGSAELVRASDLAASKTTETAQGLSMPAAGQQASSPETASAPLLNTTPLAGEVVKANLKFEYASELTTFANLRAKVFLKPEEKAERQRLLQNTQLVRSLEPLLKVPAAVGTDVGQMQNQALDLLLEAKAQGGDAAGEVLRAVVEDKTIENEGIDLQSRRLLAGLKAEVLFQWSAQEPGRAGDIQRCLPGPVSQRIWENVRDVQQQNLADSESSRATATTTSEQ